MAIYYKRDIEKRLKALEEHYTVLCDVLKGRAPVEGMASEFGMSEDIFVDSRLWVNFDDVLIQLDHFKSELAAIKALKSRAEKAGR
jgi:hypothetical protein